jgi:hypothetical protein
LEKLQKHPNRFQLLHLHKFWKWHLPDIGLQVPDAEAFRLEVKEVH